MKKETDPLLQSSKTSRQGTDIQAQGLLDPYESELKSPYHRERKAARPCQTWGKWLFGGFVCFVTGLVVVLWMGSSKTRSYEPFLYEPGLVSQEMLQKPLDVSKPTFPEREHPIVPKMIAANLSIKVPIPTNQWWTNFLISDSVGMNTGEAPVTVTPYTVKSTFTGLHVSYGDFRRKATHMNITEIFANDLTFVSSSMPKNKTVVRYDALSVDLKFEFETGSSTAFLVRGSPYITLEYKNAIPVVMTGGVIEYVNDEVVGTNCSNVTLHDSSFELGIRVGKDKQIWRIYFERHVSVELISRSGAISGIRTKEALNGIVRAAVVPEKNSRIAKLLDEYAGVYPYATEVSYSVRKKDEGTVHFQWKTRGYGELLMLANPHQVDTLSLFNISLIENIGFRTIKGRMAAVVGHEWSLIDNLTTIGFDAKPWSMNNQHTLDIKKALRNDSTWEPTSLDPYFFGKEVARQARLVLIANQLNESFIQDRLLNQLEKWMEPWLVGTNNDSFVYDSVWGGICSSNGLKGVFWMTDFGNGWYNDHHFHYGYMLYALSVVGRFRPEFLQRHRQAVLSIVRDIANPSSTDPYFPLARHVSWFDGHSFASGVFVLDGGKSQESVSEAINAYYAVYLLGMSMKDDVVANFGRILLAMEIRAAKTYWQMGSHSTIYEAVFSQNKMVGQVAATKVVYTTWFGTVAEDMHLINMMPFTPITDAFLSPAYVREEYPLLEVCLNRREPLMTQGWKGYAFLSHALIDPKHAWTELNRLADFDDGNSKTNSLWWIATHWEP